MIETAAQFQARLIREVIAEYGCSVEDAATTSHHRLTEWIADSKAAMIAGDVPSQAWINTVQADDWTWFKSFLHARPDVFDRLAAAGRSVYVTQAQLNNPQPKPPGLPRPLRPAEVRILRAIAERPRASILLTRAAGIADKASGRILRALRDMRAIHMHPGTHDWILTDLGQDALATLQQETK